MEFLPDETQTSPYWCTAMIKYKGIKMLIVCIYLLPNDDGERLITMRRVYQFVRDINLPYLIGGGYNMEPDGI